MNFEGPDVPTKEILHLPSFRCTYINYCDYRFRIAYLIKVLLKGLVCNSMLAGLF
jgi:hypothetical protein